MVEREPISPGFVVETIEPNADALFRVFLRRCVAVVFHEPLDDNGIMIARSCGWPRRTVLALPARLRKRLRTVDAFTRRWLDEKQPGIDRMVVFAGRGLVLVEHSMEGEECWLVHGSVDLRSPEPPS